MDFLNRPDLYSSFVPYQQQLMQVFDEFVEVYGFHTVDANRSVAEVFGDLRGHVTRIVSDMKGART
jgi:thymidylate kinase